MKIDLYETVTNRVLEMMETHGSNWINPFARKGASLLPYNIASKKAYRGVNTLLLGWSPFSSPVWGTYKQWNERDCQVRKGEKGTVIVFWQFIEKDDQPKPIPFLRHYTVFNADQVDGYEEPATEEVSLVDTLAAADQFFATVPANVKHTAEGRAYYSPSGDYIHMPKRDVFEATPTSTATECYYSTLSHELVHWTGHKSRMDRDLKNGFGSEGYAREELVAEIGAALLCATLGISAEPRPDHAHYLNGWMTKLADHKREFVSAAGAAARAVDFIAAYQEERIAA